MNRLRTLADRGPLLLIIIVIIGAVLRLIGVWWGVPPGLHPDEPVIVNGALDLAARHSFEPSMYQRPDHVEIKLSYLAYTAVSYLFFHQPVLASYAEHPGVFLVISRLITVAFGCAMIVLAFFIGRRFARPVGLIAAAIFAVYPAFVEHSHYATPDIPLTAVLMVVVLACMSYLKAPRIPSLLVASVASAAAIAIKYPGALATVVIAVSVVLMAVRDRDGWRIVRHGLLAVGTVIGALFLISPVLFTNLTGVRAAIASESRTTHDGADGLGVGGNLLFYGHMFFEAAGLLLTLAAIVGVVGVIRRRERIAVPLVMGAVFWVALSVLPLHWERWGVPMYAFAGIMAALGIRDSAVWLRQRSEKRRWMRVVAVVLVAVSALQLVAGSIAIDARLTAPDSRLTEKSQLLARGITATNSISEGYSPFKPASPRVVFDAFDLVGDRLVPIDPDRRYLVLSSCMNDRYFADSKYVEQQKFYARVAEDFTLIYEVQAIRADFQVGIEGVDIVRNVLLIGQYAHGTAGCTLQVYDLTAIR